MRPSPTTALGHILAALAIAALTHACSTSHAPADASIDSDVIAPDVPNIDAPPEAAPPRDVPSRADCTDASPPTQSFSLDSWPQYTATTAPDLTAAANVVTTGVPGAASGVAATHDGAWLMSAVAYRGSGGELSALQRTGNTLTYDHGITLPTNETPFGIALSHDGTMVAVSMSDELALLSLAGVEANDPAALLATVPTHSPMRTSIDVTFSQDDLFAFVALEYDHGVSVVDVTAQAYVGKIPIAGDAVTGVVLSPDGNRLYVTCEVTNEFIAANPSPANDQVVGGITVVDAVMAESSPSSAVIGRAFVGRAPVRAAVSPDGGTIWVTVRGSNAVLALDTAMLLSTTCNPLIASIPVGPAPVGLAFFAGGAGVAVANSNRFLAPNADQTVMLIDVAHALAGSSTPVFGQVTVGAFPREIDDDSTALFVSNYDSLTISGLDLTALPVP